MQTTPVVLFTCGEAVSYVWFHLRTVRGITFILLICSLTNGKIDVASSYFCCSKVKLKHEYEDIQRLTQAS